MSATPDDAEPSRLLMPSHEHSWPHPRVATGSGVWTADDVATLRRAGITHVIDCRLVGAPGLYRDSGIAYLSLPTDDDAARKPDAWFERGIRFALEALRDPRAKVLAHCVAGINRGPSMTYAILRAMDLDALAAERAIRLARPLVGLAYRLDAERAVGPWVTR